MLIVQLLILLIATNAAPVVATRLCGERWSAPLDGGRVMADGYRLLGSGKTWRGVCAAVTCCAATAALLNPGWLFGGAFGALSMLGDLLSSFIKRRMGLADGARATGLDQGPEALLPLLATAPWLAFGAGEIALCVGLFALLEILLSPVLYRLGIRSRPY